MKRFDGVKNLLTEVPRKFQKHLGEYHTRIRPPDLFLPTDAEPIEYLRFNRQSREDILGVRLDYQFTPRLNIIGGFQYRKFSNRDKNFKNYLQTFSDDTDVPNLYRPDLRTRILGVQAIKANGSASTLSFFQVIGEPPICLNGRPVLQRLCER